MKPEHKEHSWTSIRASSSDITTNTMGWPYHLLDLTHEQKHERRLLLDRYGVYAQLSALIPILAYQLYRLGVWVYSERKRSKASYSAIPSSPTLKRSRASTAGNFARKWRSTIWWLEGELAVGWPSRGQFIAAGVWTSWLLFLCVHKTGEGMCFVLSSHFIVDKPISYLVMEDPKPSCVNMSHYV